MQASFKRHQGCVSVTRFVRGQRLGGKARFLARLSSRKNSRKNSRFFSCTVWVPNCHWKPVDGQPLRRQTRWTRREGEAIPMRLAFRWSLAWSDFSQTLCACLVLPSARGSWWIYLVPWCPDSLVSCRSAKTCSWWSQPTVCAGSLLVRVSWVQLVVWWLVSLVQRFFCSWVFSLDG